MATDDDMLLCSVSEIECNAALVALARGARVSSRSLTMETGEPGMEADAESLVARSTQDGHRKPPDVISIQPLAWCSRT